MRIVIVVLEAPLPFGHVTGRSSSVLLKELVARGHEVTMLAACSRAHDITAAESLFPTPMYDLRLYPFPVRRGLRAKIETLRRPFSYMFSDAFKADLKQTLASGYDVVHFEQLSCGWLGSTKTARSLAGVYFLFDIDLENVVPSGVRGRLERYLMRKAERKLLRRFRYLTTLSERLSARVREMAPLALVTTTPFSLDPGQYDYISDRERTVEPLISVIGNMEWYPSYSSAVRLLSRLWPEIKQQIPNARAQVIGWNAKRALRDFLLMPDVTIEENVPDIRPYFERTGVLVYAPGRGSGMKIKVLEAFAFGVPVVTTAEGVEGVPALDGVHAGIADDDAGLVSRTVHLLKDPVRQNRQRAAARLLLEQHCGPASSIDRLEAVYRGVVRAESN